MDRSRRFVVIVLFAALGSLLTYYLLNGTNVGKTTARLIIEAEGPPEEKLELFVDPGLGYFQPQNSSLSETDPQRPFYHVMELPDAAFAVRLRLDPGQKPGLWRFRSFRWEGPQYTRVWTPEVLDSLLVPLQGISSMGLHAGALEVVTKSHDPALEIRGDVLHFWHFIRTPAAVNKPAALAAFLTFLLLSCAFHVGYHRLQALESHVHWALLLGGFLFLPLVVMWGEPKPETSEEHKRENRRLAPLPRLEWDSLFSLPDRWTAYFHDHMGLKSFLAALDGRWKYGLLNSSPKPFEVEIGRHGWLFSRDTSLLRDYLHWEKMPLSVMRRMRLNLEYIQMWLSRRGIRFFVFVAHNKHSIYPHHLPSAMSFQDRPSIYEQWKAYMIDSSFVMPIDAGDELRAAARDNEVYYPYDTHWNFHGGLLAYRKLMLYIARDFPQCQALADSLFQWVRLDERNADLARKIALQDVLHNKEYQPSLRIPSPARPLPPPDLPHVPLLQPSLAYSVDNPALPRLLMYRDSYANLMVPYLTNHFSYSLFLWTHALDPLTITRIKPDVVVVEIAEQHIRNLASLDTTVFARFVDE
ncbi:MAG: hypothetical protein NZM65_00665 [Flavobacteriales bacterium]|nr:hypothetical protein [Flavobacteriales bacterium]MDW8409180.1 hypothetical protein [Flavobacteriales bacterium]